MVGAEKLPDVCVGERVVFVLRFFEPAAAIGTEVLSLHFLEASRDLLVALVFQHLLHQLFAVFVVFFYKFGVAFFGWEQFLHLEGHQAASHVQEVARFREVGNANLVDPSQKVVGDFGDRNLVQGHFLFLDQVYEQVHRPVERPDVDFVIFLFFDIYHLLEM